ncbi:hypothetical protein [Dolichospermum flos-aquae]|nr:hypothetical protein [Dolichospermum flos-aquae]
MWSSDSASTDLSVRCLGICDRFWGCKVRSLVLEIGAIALK